MTDKTTGLRCQNGDACAAGQKACPSPEACGCAPEEQPLALVIAEELTEWADEYAPTELALSLAIAASATVRNQHARITVLESAAAQHQQELRAYDLTVQNLRAEMEAVGAGGVEGLRKQGSLTPEYLVKMAYEDCGIVADDCEIIKFARIIEAAQPSRECLQQSATPPGFADMADVWRQSANDVEATANTPSAVYHQGVAEGLRTCARDLEAALKAAPQAPAAVAVPKDWKKHVLDAWVTLRNHNSSIPDDLLDEMKARLLAAAPAQEHATQLAGQGQEDALRLALNALEAIAGEMTIGERYTSAGQHLLDALNPCRAAVAAAKAQKNACDDSVLLNFLEDNRVSLIPEYDGPWDARVYGEDGQHSVTGTGDTVRAAIEAARAAQGDAAC